MALGCGLLIGIERERRKGTGPVRAASVFSLAAGAKITSEELLLPLLAAFTTNTVSKLVAAWTTGGRRYALRVAVGLFALAVGVWAPCFWRS